MPRMTRSRSKGMSHEFLPDRRRSRRRTIQPRPIPEEHHVEQAPVIQPSADEQYPMTPTRHDAGRDAHVYSVDACTSHDGIVQDVFHHTRSRRHCIHRCQVTHEHRHVTHEHMPPPTPVVPAEKKVRSVIIPESPRDEFHNYHAHEEEKFERAVVEQAPAEEEPYQAPVEVFEEEEPEIPVEPSSFAPVTTPRRPPVVRAARARCSGCRKPSCPRVQCPRIGCPRLPTPRLPTLPRVSAPRCSPCNWLSTMCRRRRAPAAAMAAPPMEREDPREDPREEAEVELVDAQVEMEMEHEAFKEVQPEPDAEFEPEVIQPAPSPVKRKPSPARSLPPRHVAPRAPRAKCCEGRSCPDFLTALKLIGALAFIVLVGLAPVLYGMYLERGKCCTNKGGVVGVVTGDGVDLGEIDTMIQQAIEKYKQQEDIKFGSMQGDLKRVDDKSQQMATELEALEAAQKALQNRIAEIVLGGDNQGADLAEVQRIVKDELAAYHSEHAHDHDEKFDALTGDVQRVDAQNKELAANVEVLEAALRAVETRIAELIAASQDTQQGGVETSEVQRIVSEALESYHSEHSAEAGEKITHVEQQVTAKYQELSSSLSVLQLALKTLEDNAAEQGDQQPISGGNVDLGGVRKLVEALIRKYHADQTEKVDYAVAGAGGQIRRHSGTNVVYQQSSNVLSSLFDIKLPSKPPKTMIKPVAGVGHCWPMAGSKGYAVIELRERIVPTKISLEHIPSSLSPASSSTPKAVRAWGVNCAAVDAINNATVVPTGKLLAEFEYDLGSEHHIQEHPVVDGVTDAFQCVTFEVLSNYGNPHYTCIYRVRVHGDPVPLQQEAN